MTVKPIPDGYRSVTPYLMVRGVPALLDYVKRAFGAREAFRLHRADGSTAHAEVRIGDSVIMMGEPMGELGPMPAQLYLYVEDCDAVYRRAIREGGAPVMEPTTLRFSGERYGGVQDPSGNLWWIATHVEDVSPEESAKRFAEYEKSGG